MHTTYDELPFSSNLHAERHPGHLQTIAGLHGVATEDLEGALIVEIGCGSGDALLPLAATMPRTTFVGIDSASTLVEYAQREAAALTLENITFTTADFRAWHSEQQAAIILCHGLFSWVSTALQQDLLTFFASHLSPSGLLYLSWNALPGWNIRGVVRDLLRSFVDRDLPPEKQVTAARTLLRLIEATAGHDLDRPYSLLLQRELARIAQEPDSYLFHEYLADENHPYTLTQMSALMEQQGLYYVADVQMSRNGITRLHSTPQLTADLHSQLPDYRAREQLTDFIRGTAFREGIFCKQQLSRHEADFARLKKLVISSSLRAQAPLEILLSHAEVAFCDLAGREVLLTDPLTKVALKYIADFWPGAVPFYKVSTRVHELTKESSRHVEEHLLAELSRLFVDDLVFFSGWAPSLTADFPSQPLVPAYIRRQAARSSRLTNLQYATIHLDSFERYILKSLDGTQSAAALVQLVLAALHEGTLKLAGDSGSEDGVQDETEEEQQHSVTELVAGALKTLHQAGVFLDTRRDATPSLWNRIRTLFS